MYKWRWDKVESDKRYKKEYMSNNKNLFNIEKGDFHNNTGTTKYIIFHTGEHQDKFI